MAYIKIKGNTAEGGTNGTPVTLGNSGGASGDAWNVASPAPTAPTYTNTHVDTGTLAISYFQNANAAQSITRWVTGAAYSDLSWGGTMYVSATPGANNTFVRFFSDNNYTTAAVSAVYTTANKIQIIDNVAGTNVTTGGTLGVGQWVTRFRYNAGTLTISAYAKGNATAQATVSLAVSSYTLQSMWQGIGAAVNTTFTVIIDNSEIGTGGDVPRTDLATAPVAAFSSVVTGHTAVFTDASTVTNPATLSSWAWDFGDSTTSTSQNPTKRYTTAGTYTVGLTVTDSTPTTSTQTTHSAVAVDGSTSAYLAALTQVTGWTPSSSTALAVVSDTSNTTFISSSNDPTSLALEGYFGPLVAPTNNQAFVVTIYSDRLTSTSGTVNAQLFDFDGTTQRATVTGVAIQDMTASGGSGTIAAGTVLGAIELIFPWSQVQNITPSGWDKLTLKMQITAS